jgi:hypothetical protein
MMRSMLNTIGGSLSLTSLKQTCAATRYFGSHSLRSAAMKTNSPSPSNPLLNQPLDSSGKASHDPCPLPGTHPDPAMCPDCGAVYQHGSWRWMSPPFGASMLQCPACRRSRDKRAAGYVAIEGEFAHDQRMRIRKLVESLAARQRSRHPLQRIMEIEELPDGLLISTTDVNLAQAIGETLHRAYKGNLEFHYNDEEYSLRVRWQPWI